MLDGIRVLEFSGNLGASVTGMLLADLGADVIVTADPAGTTGASEASYHLRHRGKTLVECDLATPAGLAAARRLAADSDVVIDGLPPDRLALLGVDLGELLRERPGLITCSLPSFAPELELGPLPASDPLIATLAGLASENDSEIGDLPVASCYAGLVSANCIVAAVLVRLRAGVGQHIDVPLHSALLLALGFRLLRIGDRNPPAAAASPLVTTYLCSDGRWIQLHAATPRFVSGLIDALGVDWRWEDDSFDRVAWARDSELAARVTAHLAAMFATRPADEWEASLSAAGLCCVKCRTAGEWLCHPQAVESGLAVDIETELGIATQPGRLVTAATLPPLRALERCDASAAWRKPSWLPPPIKNNVPVAALDGIRVLDLCLILAGPTCGRTLAELGADVIKVDSRFGPVIEHFWHDTNRGKRSIVVDLKTQAGQEIIWKLIERSDVVIENFRLGVADRLGIGYTQVAARFPNVIYASLNAYGFRGPMAAWPGWEQLAQATSGMQLRQAGDEGRPPQLIHNATNDYASGLALSLGVLAALAARERSGEGSHVRAALVAPAGMLQALAHVDSQQPSVPLRFVHEQERQGVEDLRRWPELRAAGLLLTSGSDHLGPVEHVGVPYRMSLTPGSSRFPAPPLGGDTIEILRDLQYSDFQIARWFGEGVVAAYAR